MNSPEVFRTRCVRTIKLLVPPFSHSLDLSSNCVFGIKLLEGLKNSSMLRRRPCVLRREEAQNPFGLGGGTKVALLARSSAASFGVEEEGSSPPLLHPPPGTLDFRHRWTDGSPAHRGPMRTAQGEQRSPSVSCLTRKASRPLPRSHGSWAPRSGDRTGRRERRGTWGSFPWEPERALNFKVVLSIAFCGV